MPVIKTENGLVVGLVVEEEEAQEAEKAPEAEAPKTARKAKN